MNKPRVLKIKQDPKNLHRFLDECKQITEDDTVEAVLIYRSGQGDPEYITTTNTLVDNLNSMLDRVKFRMLFERDQEH